MSALDPYIHLATRLVLDSITYGNPLPEWEDPLSIDYLAREAHVSRRITEYLAGRATPAKPTIVEVPRRDGQKKTWLVPSLNDQIVLQVAALALSESVQRNRIVNPEHAFSLPLNRDASRFGFVQSPFSTWQTFQHVTQERVRGQQLLQLDLEEAYPSIDVAHFTAFFRTISESAPESDLLAVLMSVFAALTRGLPLINDSLFYLGNAYLSIVDDVIARYSRNFIRYVDDYRIFDESRERLEAIAAPITRDLRALGFRLNPRKTRLGGEHDFLAAFPPRGSRLVTGSTPPADDDYISALVFDDVVDPKVLASMLVKLVRGERELGEGWGRYAMQAVRRMRFVARIGDTRHAELREELARTAIQPELVEHMRRYAATNEEWRLIWCLYVAEDLPRAELPIDAATLPPLARCWAMRAASGNRPSGIPLDAQHDMSYLDAGMARYGAHG